jgi:F-type H+-transporting ATPase subunit delta
MKTSKQARRDGKALFSTCKVSGVLDENRVRQAVTQVIARKPRGYVALLSHFLRLVKLEIDRRTARVENAVESSPALMESIKAQIARRYGPGFDVQFWINPELIGGIRVQVGSDVYDGSVRARLNELAERM